MSTDDELAVVEAHGQTPIATAARLEEHHGPTFVDEMSDGVKCGTRGHNSLRGLVHQLTSFL
jgi:hypothetical protein